MKTGVESAWDSLKTALGLVPVHISFIPLKEDE